MNPFGNVMYANCADIGLSHIILFEDGRMFNQMTGKEIYPQVLKDGSLRVELMSYDYGHRVRYSLEHMKGFYFRAPWRQPICIPYRQCSFVNASQYYVLKNGTVFSLKTWDYLVGNLSFDGYVRVLLTDDNRRMNTIPLHRLVAMAFIPNPEGKNEVNHIDGNKLNNDASNLEWNWSYENMDHARKSGLRKAAVTDEQIHSICRLLEQGYRNVEVSEILNIPVHSVKDIKAGCHMRISHLYNIPRTKHFNLKPSNNPTGAERTRISTFC